MPPKRTYIKPGQKLELDLTPAERRTILENLTLLPPEYEGLLRKVHPEQPLLLTLDDLEDFSGYIAAESNQTKNRKLRTVLDAAYEKMADLLDKFTAEEPPKSKPTKKALAAEQQEAERQKAMSDQAAFLATWAAGVLQAADQRGAKNRVLETFVPEKLERLVLTTIDDVTPGVRKRLAAGKKEFTLAEVGGMLMAVAGELCVAPVQQQVGMLMVAKSLMTAMQDWVGEMMSGEAAETVEKALRPSKTANNEPGTKLQKFPLTLTSHQRDTLLTETNVRGTLRKRLSSLGSDSRTINLTRSQLDDLNDIVGYAAVDARFPHRKRLQAVLKQIADLFGAEDLEMLARRAKSKAAKPIPRRKSPEGRHAGKAGDAQAIYQLKITLLDTTPLIWRRIQVQDCTLDKLHHYIQAVMEWTNSHMHHFWIAKKRYGRPSLNVDSLPEDHVIDSTQIWLSDVLPPNGKEPSFGYEYDFGDCWMHEIEFEGIVKPDLKVKYPVCIEGERAGPPDNCGGVPGYEYLLEVLADPSHDEYEDMLEWAGHIDPEKFDPKRATARMTKGLRL